MPSVKHYMNYSVSKNSHIYKTKGVQYTPFVLYIWMMNYPNATLLNSVTFRSAPTLFR